MITGKTKLYSLVAILIFMSLNAFADVPGKIVFVEKDDETAVEGKNEFDIMDNIYVNVFLDNPLSHYYSKNNYTYDFELKRLHFNYALRLYQKDELIGQWLYEMPREQFNTLTHLHFPLATDKKYEKERYGNMVNSWVDLVTGLTPGNHDITMKVVLFYTDIKGKKSPVLAEGDFVLDVNQENLTAFKEKYKTELPEATVIAPAIEQQIVEASDNVIEGAEPLLAIINDVMGDWSYTYDEHGNIRYRNLIATVVYRLRNGDCWVKTGYYNQEHKGYGDFGVLTFARDAEGYSDYEIDCKLVEDVIE